MALTGLSVFERGTLPRWARVRQTLESTEISDVAAAVAREFARPEVRAAITDGTRVALPGGSRGIDRIDEVLRAAVNEVRKLGGVPFIIPAMGSHGGATADGQLALLDHYGITPEAMGCEIRASMETVELGMVEGDVPCYFDRIAYEQADVVIPIGRVKPHTAFRGPIESGLMKMMAIGFGKQKGADTFHSRGFDEFHTLIPAVGQFNLEHVNIPFGIALVENGYGHLGLIEAVPARGMMEREQELLMIAKEWIARLPGESLDVLIVDEIGKNISGDGADPNVTNRSVTGLLERAGEAVKPTIQRLVVRDLTADTEGNATGMGLFDVALRRAIDKFDPVATYMNCITSKELAGARLPATVDNDRQALYIALASCHKTVVEQAKVARIENTKYITEFWASEPWLPELMATGRVEMLGEPADIRFDADGMFVD